MHPTRSRWGARGKGGKAGFHKSFGIRSTPRHDGATGASADQPQPSCCRGGVGIALSETAKKNKIAALAALMTARGMVSRDHILPPPPIETLIKKTFVPVQIRQLGRNIFWSRLDG
jgi:hypothetical protein